LTYKPSEFSDKVVLLSWCDGWLRVWNTMITECMSQLTL